jgi:vanillate O-demethylase monooxygenase subunit
MSRFLKNVWYQAGWSRELDDAGQIARTIIGQPVLVFRNADGTPAAVVDRCPHRLAPLSAGRIADGVVTCGYHGLGFPAAAPAFAIRMGRLHPRCTSPPIPRWSAIAPSGCGLAMRPRQTRR